MHCFSRDFSHLLKGWVWKQKAVCKYSQAHKGPIELQLRLKQRGVISEESSLGSLSNQERRALFWWITAGTAQCVLRYISDVPSSRWAMETILFPLLYPRPAQMLPGARQSTQAKTVPEVSCKESGQPHRHRLLWPRLCLKLCVGADPKKGLSP